MNRTERALSAIDSSTIERFWPKVDTSGDCWEWTAYRDEFGYGRFCLKRQIVIHAHRFSFAITYGAILPGLVICHKCDNRGCVNPEHLFMGTKKQNTQDAISKRRLYSPVGNNLKVVQQILDSYSEGVPIRHIARHHDIDPKTVRYHLKKAGVHNATS